MKNNCLILLVEDDQVDALTVKRALNEIKALNPLEIAGNGEEALQYLNNTQNRKPGLILLDLNMPKMNGLEFLKSIKNNDKLKRFPVIILTTSKEDQDKLESFNLGVAGYMIKPVDYQKFVEVIKTIDSYWTLSELPEEY